MTREWLRVNGIEPDMSATVVTLEATLIDAERDASSVESFINAMLDLFEELSNMSDTNTGDNAEIWPNLVKLARACQENISRLISISG